MKLSFLTLVAYEKLLDIQDIVVIGW